jgi:hypothetical protein
VCVSVLLFVAATSGVAKASAASRPKLAVMPLKAKRMPTDTVGVLDDILLKEVSDRGVYRVIGRSEIEAILDLQRQKDVLACDDVACGVELGGALGVEILLIGSASRLAGEVIFTLILINVSEGTVVRRSQTAVRDLESQYRQGISTALRDVLGTGTLSVTTVPQGAQITLDGEARGATPGHIDGLEVGKHDLSVTLGGHETVSTEVLILASKAVDIALDMKPFVGSITITSSPAGAQCAVDDKQVGATPRNIKEVPIGSHRVVVSHDGYRPVVTTVTVSRDATTSWHAELVPIPVKFQISTKPPGAEVRIDGVSVGQTAFTGEIDVGRHNLELEKQGFKNLQIPFDVAVGEPVQLAFSLEKGVSATESQSQRLRAGWRWTLTALAAASAGVWGWQGLRARGLAEEAQQEHVKSAGFEEKKSAGRRASLVADGALGAMTLSLLGAGYLWMTVEF